MIPKKNLQKASVTKTFLEGIMFY